MALIFDIETAPDLEDKNYVAWKSAAMVNKKLTDPEKIERDRMDKIDNNFGLHPMTGKIITAGFLSEAKLETQPMSSVIIENEVTYSTILTLEEYGEEELLVKCWQIIYDYYLEGHRLVTYNGYKFDIPFLWRKSVIKGIPKPPNLPFIDELNNKYRYRHHLDLMLVLNNYNEYTSLVDWAYLIGASNDLTKDGMEIQTWYKTGEWNLIRSHNLADLTRTYLLYKRVNGWFGEPL